MIPYININEYISSISKEAGSLKKELIQTIIRLDTSDISYLDDYLNFVNSFTKEWENIANDTASSMKRCELKKVENVVQYRNIKKYVFASYDYASILQFADGVIKGIEDGKFTKNSDVVDFMNHVTGRAFKGLSETTAEVVNDVCEDLMRNQNCDSDEAIRNFNVVRDYDSLFDRRDRSIIYKSIEKVTKYLIQNIVKGIDGNDNKIYTNDKMMISLVNAVIDYASYTLTAYAIRIYAIYSYATSFIAFADPYTDRDYKESADIENIGRTPIRLMSEIDDLSFRDPIKHISTIAGIAEFAAMLGYHDSQVLNHNKMPDDGYNETIKKIENNELFKLIRVSTSIRSIQSDIKIGIAPENITNVIEFNHLLQSYTKNSSQAISDSTTPKHELLYIIKNLSPKNETLEEYANIVALIKFISENTLGNMSTFIQASLEDKSRGTYIDNDKSYTASERLAITNAINIMKELYGELADAILFKMRDIEMKSNILRGSQANKISHDLEIKVPGMKDDYSLNDNMMMGIPYTTRSPLDTCIKINDENEVVVEFAELPIFEYYSLFDEYVRSLPGMKDCYYYSEALNVSSIFNAIKAVIEKVLAAFKKFMGNITVKNAAAYVNKNQARLRSMKINGTMNEIIPFQKDISITFLNTLIANVNKFDPSTMITDDAINGYFNTIFGNDKVSMIFDESKVKKEDASKVFKNYLVCGIDPATNPTGEIKLKELTDEASIKKEMEIWIDNVITYEDGLTVVSNKLKELDNAVNSIKAKITNGKAPSANTQTSAEPTGAPNMTVDDDSNATQQTQQATNQAQNSANDAKLQSAISKLQVLIAKVSNNIMSALIDSIRTQYSYIQRVEKLGKSSATTQQPQQNTGNEQTI